MKGVPKIFIITLSHVHMLIVPERHVLEMHTYMIIAYRSTNTGTKSENKKTQLFTFNLKNTDG